MNVRLQHERSFLASTWSPDLLPGSQNFLTNHYHVRIRMITHVLDNQEINIAAQRSLYMLDTEFSDTVFLNQQYEEPARFMQSLGMDVTLLPGEPVDQIIGMMLYCKLNAVMAGRITVTQLEICSERGDHVWYLHERDEPLGPFESQGWWNLEDPMHIDTPPLETDTPSIQPDPWHSLELAWPVEPVPSTVVYADFRSNDKK
jgi:hypothetical protein